MILSLLSLILATACYSIKELQSHGKLKWSKGYYGFWDERSYERKYKRNRDLDPLGYVKHQAPNTWYYRFFKIKYKERFPLSATFLVMLTDGYHMCQHISFLLLALSITLQTSSLWNFAIFWLVILLTNALTYKLLSKT